MLEFAEITPLVFFQQPQAIAPKTALGGARFPVADDSVLEELPPAYEQKHRLL